MAFKYDPGAMNTIEVMSKLPDEMMHVYPRGKEQLNEFFTPSSSPDYWIRGIDGRNNSRFDLFTGELYIHLSIAWPTLIFLVSLLP